MAPPERGNGREAREHACPGLDGCASSEGEVCVRSVVRGEQCKWSPPERGAFAAANGKVNAPVEARRSEGGSSPALPAALAYRSAYRTAYRSAYRSAYRTMVGQPETTCTLTTWPPNRSSQ